MQLTTATLMLHSASDVPRDAATSLRALSWAAGQTTELVAMRFERSVVMILQKYSLRKVLSRDEYVPRLSTSALQADFGATARLSITQQEGAQHNHSALLSTS